MDYKIIEDRLKEPFAAEDIEWRIQQFDKVKGEWAMVLAYVTNRAIMNRLDEVLGIEGWSNEYTTAPSGGILCGITTYFAEQPITKYDGAENTHIEAVKGGLSASMKRAAVMWGIGRYLYGLEAVFVRTTQLKPPNMTGWNRYYDQTSKKSYYWKTPELPAWALPSKGVKNEK